MGRKQILLSAHHAKDRLSSEVFIVLVILGWWILLAFYTVSEYDWSTPAPVAKAKAPVVKPKPAPAPVVVIKEIVVERPPTAQEQVQETVTSVSRPLVRRTFSPEPVEIKKVGSYEEWKAGLDKDLDAIMDDYRAMGDKYRKGRSRR